MKKLRLLFLDPVVFLLSFLRGEQLCQLDYKCL